MSFADDNKHLGDDENPVSIPELKTATLEFEESYAEHRLVRRLDLRILPIASLLYFVASLDRGNLGNALTLPEGIDQVLPHGDPSGRLFDWINSIFFFSYILFQVPGTLSSKIFPPRLYLGSAAVAWGICSTLMATGFNFGSLMTARFFLGIFEAGFAPSMLIYFSLFYTKHEIGLRLAYWFGFSAVAGAFSGLVAFGVAHIHSSVEQWRLLFIIEGIPAVFLGIVALFFLPNRPESTTFFNDEERKIALRRRNRGTSGDNGAVINKKHVLNAFMDWRVYACGIMYFAANACTASISAFLPTILKTLGYTDAVANLMTVPPYATAAVVLSITAMISDRLQVRGPLVAGWSAVSAIGYLILLFVAHNQRARYFAVFCVVCGTYNIIGVVIAWFAHNLGSESKRATGTPIYISMGHCGSILGSHLFLKAEAPRYIKPFAVLCALNFLSSLTAIILSISYKLDNDRRDRVHGPVSRNAPVDTSELADRAPKFRYTI